MSRHVDLNGLTWDGEPITSKIQEVKTKYGYMQGITTGWLWGDNVPYIDLDEHDKQIRDEVIEECKKITEGIMKYYRDEYHFGVTFNEMCNNIIQRLEQMKGEQNE